MVETMTDQCECLGEGFCQRFQRYMTEGLQRHCASNPKFRKRLASLPVLSEEEISKARSKIPTNLHRRLELSCIYRSYRPIEWAACDCHVYDCEIHDRAVPFRKKKLKPGIKVCDECSDRVEPSVEPIANTTIAVTYWNRPEALRRLLASIETYLPGVPVEVEDTGGNLSAGRNRLYARISTPYLVVMEEDFLVLPATAGGIRDAIKILDHDSAIAGVGGIANEPYPGKRPPGYKTFRSRGAVRWGHNFIRNGPTRVGIKPSVRAMRKTPGGIAYRPCDLVLNFGVFRSKLFAEVACDPDFPIQEHKEYFWRAHLAGKEFAFLSSLRIDHIRDQTTPQYIRHRRRSFTHRVKQKHGFTFD